ncbi:uncharacterized protein FA14DRAFT_171597 [Meira miltonrushii]|uniref:Uncharacterized protein n=1 Tax=Meira miltonrushii TaxID=1280837 RepID=A0A316VFU6_9BASI|nr:uncharacterized protein FA14DRAFT_171597 [Meira miltonrushii]PWN34871.1 hypothetical protein FA14DRAFT_171597 [Meira miltonrushii]
MRFQFILTTVLATATIASAQGLGGVISSAVSGAASVGGDITSGAAGAASTVTSGAGGIATTVTSGAGGVATTIASGGSSIVSNASSGAEGGVSNASSQLSTTAASSHDNGAAGSLSHFNSNGNIFTFAGLTVAGLAGAGAVLL